MKLKEAKILIPKYQRIVLSDETIRIDAGVDTATVEYTDGFKHTFTAIYKLIEVKKAK
jgi:hypothetical protein